MKHQSLDGARLFSQALVLRFLSTAGDTRLPLVDYGCGMLVESLTLPLVAPLEGARWIRRWSSEGPRYAGGGMPEIDAPDSWRIGGEAAVVLTRIVDP